MRNKYVCTTEKCESTHKVRYDKKERPYYITVKGACEQIDVTPENGFLEPYIQDDLTRLHCMIKGIPLSVP